MPQFERRTYGGEGREQFTGESADAVEVYVYEADPDDEEDVPPTPEEVAEKRREILGYTEFAPGDGRLTRHLPWAHPSNPNLVAFRVDTRAVTDDGFQEEESDPDQFLEAAPPEKRVAWDSVEFTVTYGPRPYAMVSDSSILKVTVGGNDGWYDEDGNIQPFSYYPEWWRFTDFDVLPRDDILKAKVGQQVFRTASGDPGGSPFPATVSIPLPNDTLKVTWYGVPYRYIKSASSYLRRFRNYVNQREWEGYAPGTLLYKGFTYRKFNPPWAELDPEWEFGVFSTEKLADITLEFIVTRRTATSPPASVSNPNWIVGGHNLLPWMRTRKFYYVTAHDPAAPADQSKWVPTFPSFPVELLWLDPDAE